MKELKEFDIVIIGAGVIGSFVARHLSRFNLKTALLEKEEDICCGVSKAHTAIVHCGYSGKPGSIKAKMTVRANENFHKVCEDLDVEFDRCGSIITAKADKGLEKLLEKLKRGKENGVKGLKLLNREETLKIEPNISDDVIASVYAPQTGVADPWEYCHAAVENALDNGLELFLNNEVISLRYEDNENSSIFIQTSNNNFRTKYLINCAGLYSDEINNMLEKPFFKIKPRKGEYIVLDKSVRKHINGFIFQAREENGPKGVIISPTIHGNLIIGPSTEDIEDKEDRSNTIKGLEYIEEISKLSVKDIPYNAKISYFSGIRPRPNLIKVNEFGETEVYEDKVKDFIINRGKINRNFINVSGIKSPGFTCADEIGKYVFDIILSDYNLDSYKYIIKKNFKTKRRKSEKIKDLSYKKLNNLINKNPNYGEVICICNKVSKNEILDAINRTVGKSTIDGIKRRTTACMGKCHGSRCKDKIEKIIKENRKKEKKLLNNKDKIFKNDFTTDIRKEFDTIIVGGGIAGISAAINLSKKGIRNIALIDREENLGGILNQCVHYGFGLKYLGENFTGIDYANYFKKELKKLTNSRKIKVYNNTEVESLKKLKEDEIGVRIINTRESKILKAKTIILATGCIEKHIGQIYLNRNRIKGIFTAGEAQKRINCYGEKIGKKVVIIGSGDIGMIMARRLTMEGVKVLAIIEKSGNISGLLKNKIECCDFFGIPIELNSEIKTILGRDRVMGIVYKKDFRTIKLECDTLITSIGLIPDNSLLEENLNINGNNRIFKLGNSEYVHDLVDDICLEAENISNDIYLYLEKGIKKKSKNVKKICSNKQEYDYICTICPRGCNMKISNDKIKGNKCKKGEEFFKKSDNRNRMHITTTIAIRNSQYERAFIRTLDPVIKEEFKNTLKLIKNIIIKQKYEKYELKLENGVRVKVSYLD